MSYRIGIDFGTCFSFIAYWSESAKGICTLINPITRTPYEIPSVFFHGDREKMRNLCGFEADELTDGIRGTADEEKYAVRYIKQQLLGENFELKGGTKSPKEIATSFFSYLAGLAREGIHAEDHNEQESANPSDEPLEAVIAVPVVFTQRERSVIIEAADEAGITVIGLIEEPVAIAIDYIEHIKNKDELEPVLVYDLGGGTVDVACIKYHPSKTHEIAVSGGTRVLMPAENAYEVVLSEGKRIGGVKWDEMLSEDILSRYEEEYKSPPADNHATPFHRIVTTTKHALSKFPEVNFPFSYTDSNNVAHNREILTSRKHFEEKTSGLLKETLDCVRVVSSRCGLKSGSKVRVVLSGGSSRMPQVREGVTRILEDELGVIISNKSRMLFRHEQAVALGAARYANTLARRDTTSGVYGVALCDKHGRLKNELLLIDKGQALPVNPVEWTINADIEDETEIVVIESYDKVPHYLTQTDKVMGIRLKLENATSISGTLSIQKGGVLKLTAAHPETETVETQFFSINTFPHPRRLKVRK